MYNRGTIILIPFPFTDLTSQKIRPVLIISKENKGEDIIVCFISSQAGSKIAKHGVSILQNNKYFKESGLKQASTIRCDKIATLSKKLALGEIGTLAPSLMNKIEKALTGVLGL